MTRMDWPWPTMIYREEGGRRLSKRPSEEDMWEATPVSSTQVVAPEEEAGDEGPFKCRAHRGGGQLCRHKGRENLWSLPKDTLPELGWRLQLMLRPSTNTGVYTKLWIGERGNSKASKIMSSRNRLHKDRYQLIQVRH